MTPVEFYQVEPWPLFAGEYPGHWGDTASRERLYGLVKEQGVRTFIDLTHPDDGLLPYEPLLSELGERLGLELHRYAHPITDQDVPSPSEMTAVLDRLHQEFQERRPAYVHCWGGIGRTGTVVGCWLREFGLEAEPALARLQELFSTLPKSRVHPTSPQTPVQFAFIQEWSSSRTKAAPAP
ncbi:MAG: protein-tyrosine phosphatase family protein [Verrucomicrobiota bacterium]